MCGLNCIDTPRLSYRHTSCLIRSISHMHPYYSPCASLIPAIYPKAHPAAHTPAHGLLAHSARRNGHQLSGMGDFQMPTECTFAAFSASNRSASSASV